MEALIFSVLGLAVVAAFVLHCARAVAAARRFALGAPAGVVRIVCACWSSELGINYSLPMGVREVSGAEATLHSFGGRRPSEIAFTASEMEVHRSFETCLKVEHAPTRTTEAQGVVGIEVVVLDVFSPRWRADLRECRAPG